MIISENADIKDVARMLYFFMNWIDNSYELYTLIIHENSSGYLQVGELNYISFRNADDFIQQLKDRK